MNTERNNTSKNTPIYYLDRFNENDIYIKRDDFVPVSFGGNKARKALLFFEEIDKTQCDCIVTYGSSSSNHCRIVSNMAAMRGMPCFIISPEEASEPTNNQKMMNLFGAEITVVPVKQVHDAIEEKLQKLKDSGYSPYFIAGGGHGNLGTEAYVNCYKEILEYERAENIFFDRIYFASGTGTTQAGLVCGQLLEKSNRVIVGISIARKNPYGRNVVVDSIKAYFENKGICSISEEEIQNKTIFLDQYTGQGYAGNDMEVLKEVKYSLCKYGIPMDRTYTGKAFYGMKQDIKEKGISNERILFIHTGGTPLFFDDLKQLVRIENGK